MPKSAIQVKVPNIVGYHISQGYSRVTIWFFNGDTKALMLTQTSTPNRRMSRAEKYERLCQFLDGLSIPRPVYVAKGKIT